MITRPARLVVLVLAAALGGCAGAQPPRPDNDPWERYNRAIFAFNDAVDTYGLEPAAKGWDWLVPDMAQRGLSNFFDNLRFPVVLVNDLLQARFHDAAATTARFQCNTFLGGLGFYDLAADFGVPAHVQDTGLTLGRWGIAPGPFFMLPLLGPSSPRDAGGLVADGMLAVYPYFVTIPGLTAGLGAIDILNRRARVLDQVRDVKAASLDYYTFVRNAYVQRRWKLIHGETPTAAEQEELYNDEVFEGYLEEGQ
jgi:phospholipid-binding lipoprotein MlaA